MATTTESSNILGIKIKNIWLKKFANDEKINLIPQFINLYIFQSIFQPSLRAELTIIDPIGLMHNWPLVGEETIEIEFEHTRQTPTVMGSEEIRSANQKTLWKFMVNSTSPVKVDRKGRQQMYMLELFTPEMLTNARRRLQKAYLDTYDASIKKILLEELKVDPTKVKDTQFHKSRGRHHVIVPNMKPFEAITWMNKRAVAESSRQFTFCFYENFDGYNFKTIEAMFGIDTELEVNPKASYVYVPNFSAMADKNAIVNELQTKLKNPAPYVEISAYSIITAMQINTKFNTLEKTAMGYFENGWMDIDLFNRDVHQYNVELDYFKDTNKLGKVMNTQRFIANSQSTGTNPEYRTRVKYSLSQNEGDSAQASGSDQGKNFFKFKFGEVQKRMVSLSQVAMTISVPGDTRINVGDMIELFFFEQHGYTRNFKVDPYFTGKYIITDKKDMITVGSEHIMVLNIHRASYESEIAAKSNYGAALNG